MDRRKFLACHMSPLMVIRNLYFESVPLTPAETDSPLIVNPNAILPPAIARQFLQTISGRDSQLVERLRGIEDQHFSLRHALNVRRPSPGLLSQENPLGISVPEALDHSRSGTIITYRVNNVKRYQIPPGVPKCWMNARAGVDLEPTGRPGRVPCPCPHQRPH